MSGTFVKSSVRRRRLPGLTTKRQAVDLVASSGLLDVLLCLLGGNTRVPRAIGEIGTARSGLAGATLNARRTCTFVRLAPRACTTCGRKSSSAFRSRTGSIRRCSAESCSGSNHLRCPAALGVDHLREKPILGEMPNLLRTGAIPRWIESSDFAIKKRNGHTSSVESALCLLSSE
jgi:hypothetical protein